MINIVEYKNRLRAETLGSTIATAKRALRDTITEMYGDDAPARLTYEVSDRGDWVDVRTDDIEARIFA